MPTIFAITLTALGDSLAVGGGGEIGIFEVVGYVAALVAVVALGFAAKQYRDARHTLGKLEALTTNLQEVTMGLTQLDERLSTRYLDVFPGFMDKLNGTLEGAKVSIEIVCDVPAYGIFSANSEWLRYAGILQKKAQNDKIEVTMTYLNETERRKHHTLQFPMATSEWSIWKNEADNVGDIDILVKQFRSQETVRELTADGFAELFVEADKHAIERLFSSIELHEISAPLPLYYWIVDGNRAIFAIATYADPSSEYGFQTNDSALISAFQAMQLRYLQNFEASTS